MPQLTGPLYNVKEAAAKMLLDRWYQKPCYYSFQSDSTHMLRCYQNSMKLIAATDKPECEPTILPVDSKIFIYCSADRYSSAFLEAFLGSQVFPAISDQMAFIEEVIGLSPLEELVKNRLLWSASYDFPDFPGVVLRQTKKHIFWFDSSWTLQVSEHEGDFPSVTFVPGLKLWAYATYHFKPGSSFSECFQMFLQTKRRKSGVDVYSDLERLVQKISFSFERIPENRKPNTFDRIRVEASIGQFLGDFNTTFLEIKKRKAEILEMVIDRLQDSKRFQKYDVPINFLRLSSLVFSRSFLLEFIFELKEFNWESHGDSTN